MTRGWSQQMGRFNGRKVYRTFVGIQRGLKMHGIETAVIYKIPNDRGYMYLEPYDPVFEVPTNAIATHVWNKDRIGVISHV